MNCNAARELFFSFVDGELDEKLSISLQGHLDGCSTCRADIVKWQKLCHALQELNREEIAAPSALASTVMKRIDADIRVSGEHKRAWPKIAAIAAALTLAVGSLTVTSDKLLQMADNSAKPPVVEQKQPAANSSYPDNTTVNKTGNIVGTNNVTRLNIPSSGSQIDPGNLLNKLPAVANNTAPVAEPEKLVFLNKERILITNTVTIKSSNLSAARQAVDEQAQKAGAAIELLGQQSTDEQNNVALKITVPSDKAGSLANQIASLGDLVNKQQQKQDLSSQFEQTYEQYLSLFNKYTSATTTPAEKTQLKKQIAALEDQLTQWDKQSSQQTIVLMIEQ